MIKFKLILQYMLPYTHLSVTIHFPDQAFTESVLKTKSKFHACFQHIQHYNWTLLVPCTYCQIINHCSSIQSTSHTTSLSASVVASGHHDYNILGQKKAPQRWTSWDKC